MYLVILEKGGNVINILIDLLLKAFSINLCTTYSYIKMNNFKIKEYIVVPLTIILSIMIAFIELILKQYLTKVGATIISYFIYNVLLSLILKNKFGYSLISVLLSLSISFITYSISSFILLILAKSLNILQFYNNPIFFIAIFIFQFTLSALLFKIKRLKDGFPFLKNKNEYLDVVILNISIAIIFIYFFTCYYVNSSLLIPFKSSFIILTLFAIIVTILTEKSFVIYQKQKLLEKTLKDYEQELSESKTQFELLLKEKNNLVKANHEFYHRQQALNLKLDTLIKKNKLLFKEEYGSIMDRINTLSTEYGTAISNNETPSILPKTNITEIDDMFIYMQNECQKNNIDFTLRLTSDIYQLLNNIIPKNKFETLIGDLIRNSIIAINCSSNNNRSIMVILGIKDNTYEFSVYDTGIEFEIETLSKLGLERATTHANTGGTGIGFITTFETLKYCNDILIITEFSDKNFDYTKSITIKFDSENNYIIETYRAENFAKDSRIKVYQTNNH